MVFPPSQGELILQHSSILTTQLTYSGGYPIPGLVTGDSHCESPNSDTVTHTVHTTRPRTAVISVDALSCSQAY
jgi:hypothetical protein